MTIARIELGPPNALPKINGVLHLRSKQSQIRSRSMTFTAERERAENHTHVLVITTGSVASIKAPLIVAELLTVRQAVGPDQNR
jgi:hypothetical protein